MRFNQDYRGNQFPATRNKGELPIKGIFIAVLLLLCSLTLTAQSSSNTASSTDSNCSEWYSAGDIERWLATWPEPDIYPYKVLGRRRNVLENEYRLCFRPQPEGQRKLLVEVHFGMPDELYQKFDEILTSLGYIKVRPLVPAFEGWNKRTHHNAVWTKSSVNAEGGVANSSLEKLRNPKVSSAQPSVPADRPVSKPGNTARNGNTATSAEQQRDKPTCTDEKKMQILIGLSLEYFMKALIFRSEQQRLKSENSNYKPLGLKEFLIKDSPEIYQKLMTRLDRRCSPSSSASLQREK
jgi:hypothetical protein